MHYYLDLLENSVMPQLHQDMDRDFIFQQDGPTPLPPPYFHREGISYLNRRVVAWIGRGGTIAWPP